MKQAENHSGTINLSAEIKIREDLSQAFDSFLRSFKGGLSAETPQDIEALAVLLAETIEARKRIEAEEKALKAELKRHLVDVMTVKRKSKAGGAA